jgi:signal transduction histidine kinase
LKAGTVSESTISALDDAAETIRQSIDGLRTLLIDFYPPDLARRGLPAALGDLAALAGARGLEVELHVPPEFDPPPAAAGLLFRAAQEGLRNASTHAQAERVAVHAGEDGDRVWLEVSDDGVGVEPDAPIPDGHLGLRAMRDLFADSGGHVSLRSAPGAGSVLHAELPVGAQ